MSATAHSATMVFMEYVNLGSTGLRGVYVSSVGDDLAGGCCQWV